jgi:hypothetical protein
MQWQPWRYDVLGTEKIEGKNCFVLQKKVGDTTPAQDGPRSLYYVRTDNWRIVREVEYFWQHGKLLGPNTLNCPQGMFGPFPGEPRLPLFPLDTASVRDSTFRQYHVARFWARLRQFSGPADSTLLNRYCEEPDTSGGRPVPSGGSRVLFALSELGDSQHPSRSLGDSNGIVPADYSIQLWNSDYPWCLYEELGQYARESGARLSEERSWLIRCGHTGK